MTRRPPASRVTRLPAAADLTTAVEAGLGWAMVPELLARGSEMVVIDDRQQVDVPIYWKQWTIALSRAARLASAILAAAAAAPGKGTTECLLPAR